MPSLYTDGDIATWEFAETAMLIPANTDFMALEVLAIENIHNDSNLPEFDGHFADTITFEIGPKPLSPFIIEDFEDGDYTLDPTWVMTNTTNDVAMITADPVRQDNLVFAAHGTESSPRILETYLDLPEPWAGFDFSAEVFTSNDNYRIRFFVYNEQYLFRFVLYSQQGNPDVHFRILETDGYDNTIVPPIGHPINEWWRLHLWHEIETNLIHAEIRLAEDDTLLSEQVFTPAINLADVSGITTVAMSFQESGWQYADNIILDPGPYVRAVNEILLAIDQKTEAIRIIDSTISNELAAIEALNEILTDANSDKVSKRQARIAEQNVLSAIHNQTRARSELSKAIANLETSLERLGWPPNE